MNRFFLFLLLILYSCSGLLTGCSTKPAVDKTKNVYIDYKNGKYTLYKNGKPFLVKGGAGFTNLAALRAAGGNTIRTWDTTGLSSILDEAAVNNLVVIAGLYLPNSFDVDGFYKDTAEISNQYKLYSAVIRRFKNHPALLCWCLGNELIFPYKPSYKPFYEVFNRLTDMIHREDSDHPVTTTCGNFTVRNVFNITNKTSIDFISFNVFGGIHSFEKDLTRFSWYWKGPFLVTEWGIDGPWEEGEKTAWGAYIEGTSTKKAEQLLATYRQYMPVNNNRFLGSLVFYWGQKQETTATWFSLFDENGAASASVSTVEYIWTGQQPAQTAPHIKYMLLDDKGARDNILLTPGTNITAKLLLDRSDTSQIHFKWAVLPEDWYKTQYVINQQPMQQVQCIVTNTNDSVITFRAPLRQGPYRIFVYVYDTNGNFATCNTPFYVVDYQK